MYQKTPGTVTKIKDSFSTSDKRYCPTCGRAFEPSSPYQLDSNYFKYLSASLNTSNERTKNNGDNGEGNNNDNDWGEVNLENLENLTRSIFNQGYYERFFREGRKLGRGAHGSVFHCQHYLESIVLGEFAIKKIPIGDNKEWLRKALQEVKLLERLKCANIVEYKHSWIELHKPNSLGPRIPCLFILMQYANGESLEELIEGTRLNEFDIISIFIQVLQGVFYLHSNGIIHRDLKPSNILLNYLSNLSNDTEYSPQVLISDLGECISESVSTERYKEATGNTGTLEFCAPEVLKGKGHSAKSDIWSLGLILYFMYFNRLPFKNWENKNLLEGEICSNDGFEFDDDKDKKIMDSRVRAICLKMLDRNPKNRPDMGELLIFFKEIGLIIKSRERRYLPKFLYITEEEGDGISRLLKKLKKLKKFIFSKSFAWFLFVIDIAFVALYCYPKSVNVWIMAFSVTRGYLLWRRRPLDIYFFLIFLFSILLILFNRRILCA